MGQTKLNEEQVVLTNYKKAAQTTAEISAAVQTHNTDGSAHADIRTTLAGKAEQTALSAHTARTDNPHAVTKAQVGLGNVDNTADADKPVSSAVQAALERKQDDDEFHPEDYGWPDIRPAARPNAIVLLAGAKADYSAYDNLGFKATCEGGYNVFIDGVQYGTTYASGAQCSITWSQYSVTAGFSITQPQALTAHIVQIVPATADNNITVFKCVRVATSGQETQGVLWVHFNLQTAITIQALLQDYASLYCPLCKAITAVNDLLKVTNAKGISGQGADRYSYGADLDYCAPIDLGNASGSFASTFNMSSASSGSMRSVHIKNASVTDMASFCANAQNLQEIKTEGVSLKPTTVTRAFLNCSQLKRLPQIDFTNTTSAFDFVKGASGLQDTMLDLSYANLLTNFHFYNAPGLKGLLVSSQAPFSYSSAPQINISNTGLDQAALVALFNSLPYNVGYTVVGSLTIQDGVVSGFTANDFLRINQKSVPDMEIIIPVHTGTFSGNTENITAGNIVISRAWNKVVSAVINLSAGGTVSLSGTTVLSDNTDYWIKLTYDGNIYKIWLSTDGEIFNEEDQKESTNAYSNNAMIIGKGNQNPWPGSIDVGHMTIMLTGIPYFRGTAAMGKTMNITGAAGAAALTSEQLAIATDKGWTVTR